MASHQAASEPVPKITFSNQREADALKYDPDCGRANVEAWYAKEPGIGLGIRLSKTKKVWFCTFRLKDGTKTRLNIGKLGGRFEVTDLATARREALKIASEAIDGKDPRTTRRDSIRRASGTVRETVAGTAEKTPPSERTFVQQWEVFLRQGCGVTEIMQDGRDTTTQPKLASWRDYHRRVSKDFLGSDALGNVLLSKVTRKQVSQVIDKIEKGTPAVGANGEQLFELNEEGTATPVWERKPAPVGAARTLEAVKVLFSWSAERGDIETNVTQGMKPPAKAAERTRRLSKPELVSYWQQLDRWQPDRPVEIAVLRLMWLSAQRRNEIVKTRWRDLNFDEMEWTQPPESTKQRREHRLPLTSPMAAEFRRMGVGDPNQLVFPEPSNPVKAIAPWRTNELHRALCRDAGISEFRPHDARRSVSTRMGDLEIFDEIIARILGHTIKGTTALYNKSQRMKEQREALEAWQRELFKIVRGDVAVMGL